MSDTTRLSLFEAARVVARRDFHAILFSRAFFFFLLGPLFPIIIGAMAGGIGGLDHRAFAQQQQEGQGQQGVGRRVGVEGERGLCS